MKRNGKIEKGENGWPSTIEVNDGPYITSRVKGDAHDSPAGSHLTDELDDLPLTDVVGRTPRGRKVVLIGILILGMVCALLAYFLFYRDRHRIDYMILEKRNERPEMRTLPGSGTEVERTDQITADANSQAKEELRKATAGPVNAPPQAQGEAQIAGPQPVPGVLTPYSVPDYSAQKNSPVVPGSAGIEVRTEESVPRQSTVGNNQLGRNIRPSSLSSGQAASHSIYVADPEKTKVTPVSQPSRAESNPASTATIKPTIEAKRVHLPDFGAMLPVRTLGKVYTLRSTAIVRLEATRDVTGEGWTIKRGTILVAELQGGEVDRAFVTVKGFIDQDTNRFVKLSGDVLGNDGAPGLKGKRRQVSSRWSRVFSRASAGALLLGQAALSRSGATVIIPGSSGIGGIGSDFGLSNSTVARREFVEISANSTAYVLVTSLPKEAQGTDVEPAAEATEILNDDELAELLSSGTPEQIRDALPRMSAEMRKLALLVLGNNAQ
jgi:hypothetical protein